MKWPVAIRGQRPAGPPGFSLVEVVVAMGIVGTVFMALYSGLTYGFSRIQLSREELRATQILMEKMETIRLYNWDQINDEEYIPREFTASYAPTGGTNSQGVTYYGEVEIDTPELDTNYESKMRQVTVTLEWWRDKKKKTIRTRSISTFVAEVGLHSHVYEAHFH